MSKKKTIQNNFILVNYKTPRRIRYKPNFIVLFAKIRDLCVITWRCRAIILHVRIIKCLILYKVKCNYVILYNKIIRNIYIIYKYPNIEIIDIYYIFRRLHIKRTKHTKRTKYTIKRNKFILVFVTSLIVIVWRYRVIMLFTKKIGILVKYKVNYLCVYFRKMYGKTIYYLERSNIRIVKKIRNFVFNKEKTFIEYQINIYGYNENISYLFDHLCQHTLNNIYLISSIKINAYIFNENRLLPQQKQLWFNRLPSTDIVNQIKLYFKIAKKNYENYAAISEYGSGAKDDPISHIGLRLYFKKPPVKTELLIIKPFIYYTKIDNDQKIILKETNKTNLLLEDKIEEISIRVLADQAFTESGYTQKEVQFTVNNSEKQ